MTIVVIITFINYYLSVFAHRLALLLENNLFISLDLIDQLKRKKQLIGMIQFLFQIRISNTNIEILIIC